MSTYNTILKELQKVNESADDQIFILSKKETVYFRRLNVKAQKSIIRSALDSDGTNITFNINANKLIYEHTSARNFLTTDRPLVLMALRNNNINTQIEIDGKPVNINKRIQEITENVETLPELKTKKTITQNNITIFTRVPTLEIDTRFLTACRTAVGNMTVADEVSESIGTMYVYELAKVVERIQYKINTPALSGEEGSTQIHTVKFDDTSVEDCVSMVELLPATINAEIVKFIAQIREYETAITTNTDPAAQIPIDVSLFTLD